MGDMWIDLGTARLRVADDYAGALAIQAAILEYRVGDVPDVMGENWIEIHGGALHLSPEYTGDMSLRAAVIEIRRTWGQSYQEMVTADEPLFYLPGDSMTDVIGGLVGEPFGGTVGGGPPIAPGLAASLVNPPLDRTDPTVVGVGIFDGTPAVEMGGHPIVEFWVALDRFGGAPSNPDSRSFVTCWALQDATAYLGIESYTTEGGWDAVQAAFAGNAGDFSTSIGRVLHIVTGVSPSAAIVINGTLVLPGAPAPALDPSTAPLAIGCSAGAFGDPYTGQDRIPGRFSDFAIYGDGDTRDMLDLAQRHYARGSD